MWIFISYRRDDSQDATGRIDDQLRRDFGEVVFRDIDSIPLGSDFAEVIHREVGSSCVVLAVIGPGWVTPRLGNEDDLVRLEIEAALRLRIPIVPLFVGGASMPMRHQVPATLQPLLRKHGMRVDSGRDFRSHMRLLSDGIRRLLQAPPPAVASSARGHEPKPAPAVPTEAAPAHAAKPPDSQGPRLSIIVTAKGGAQHKLDFAGPEILIGRIEANDLCLPRANVSKYHARIIFRDGNYIIMDEGSSNGTYVNGQRVTHVLVVRHGDKIYISDFILTVVVK